MNALDSERLLGLLEADGYRSVAGADEADLVLVNTCSVRDHAEHKAYSLLGQYARQKRFRPDLIVGMIGCLAQREGERVLSRAPALDLVVGPGDLDAVPSIVRALREDRRPVVAVTRASGRMLGGSRRGPAGGAVAFVEVSHGCDRTCTFCIVPTVRGRETSRPPAEIEEEVRVLADQGVREVVLLGQTVNSYGRHQTPRTSLAELLGRLDAVPRLARIRMVTSHPRHMDDDLIEAMRSLPKVCPHLPLPVQSGSDRILKGMNRNYTAGEYRDLVARMRDRIAGLELSTDWIVGFPGETDADFEETRSLLREIRFQQSYVFKYSPRPGTSAQDLADDVPEEVKKERNEILLREQDRISLERHTALLGSTQEVLVEGPSARSPQRLAGRTRSNDIAVFEGPATLAGTLALVEFTGATARVLRGWVRNRNETAEASVTKQTQDAGASTPDTPVGSSHDLCG